MINLIVVPYNLALEYKARHNGQTHLKNLAANSVDILKCV